MDAGVTGAELQLREFFAAEHGRLRGLGYLLTSDWAEAEELAQDALVRTYRAWSRVRRHDRPGAYARKVLVNRHRSLLRRARVEARNLAGRRGEEAVQPGPAQGGARLADDGGDEGVPAMIERQLEETFERAAAGGPEQAGAYDRFLRRQARRSRRAARSTGLVLVVLLGLAVALPNWRGPARPPVAGTTGGAVLVSAGEPVDRRWFPGPLVAAAPSQGFEADGPAGWEVRPTWKGFELRPASPELRRRLAGPVELTTTYLEAFYQPGGREQYQDGSQPPEAAMPRTPAGPELGRGRLPGGRSWFRTDGRVGRWHTTSWFVSWPYHCTGGRDCPDVLSLRALRVSYTVERGSAAEAAAIAERLLDSARPRGNAVPGAAHAPRPDCVDGRTMAAVWWFRGVGPTRGGQRPSTVVLRWTFRPTGSLVPCTVRGPVEVDLLDGSGRRLQVEGNGHRVSPLGDLPESRASSEPAGTLKLTMVWRNWCGHGPVRLRWVGEPVERRAMRIPAPACADPSKPSVLIAHRDPR